MDIYIRKNGIFPDRYAAVYIADLQIAVFTAYRAIFQYAVAACYCFASNAAVHMAAPPQRRIGVNFFRHQMKDLLRRPEMDKLRRRQSQKLHPERMQRLPHASARLCQRIAVFPFRFFLIKGFQRGLLRQRIQKIPI